MQTHLAATLQSDHATFRVISGRASWKGLVGEVRNQLVEICTPQGPQHIGTVQDIEPIDPAEMDEHFSTRLTEDKPRITFIGDATIRFHGYIGRVEQLANTEEIGEFLIAPILLRIGEETWQRRTRKTTQADSAILIYVERQRLDLVVQEMLLRRSVSLMCE